RRRIYLVLAVAFLWSSGKVATQAAEAPFGLSWGPVTTVPRPSMVDREANITALFYFHDKLPASGRDTQQVVLEVCQDEGLQQVIWVSQAFSQTDLAAKYDLIYREGVRRHGEPVKDGRLETVVWPSGHIILAVRSVEDGRKRLIMIATGEQYERCSATHQTSTGHPASVHTSTLLDTPTQ
ncbi:threonyl-trna synthetase, partial [Methylobacterium sp. DB0501]|uniref:threonyl-trna synthetase n=1 Tax=Methylobacterium sp. DB0501 TaxID=2709665 RepID=UPI0028AC7050